MSQDEASETERFLDCTTDGARREFIGQLFIAERTRLRQMVVLRLDTRLQGRLDPSDVLQEAYLEATRRMGEYVQSRPMPVFLWVRRLTAQKLVDLHRHHLGAQARDARREVSIDQSPLPQVSSATLAVQLVGQSLRPSQEAARDEVVERVRGALDSMNPIDREVLALRHFEQLSNVDAAQVLEIEPKAASKRHSRAIRRLRRILKGLPDVAEPDED